LKYLLGGIVSAEVGTGRPRGGTGACTYPREGNERVCPGGPVPADRPNGGGWCNQTPPRVRGLTEPVRPSTPEVVRADRGVWVRGSGGTRAPGQGTSSWLWATHARGPAHADSRSLHTHGHAHPHPCPQGVDTVTLHCMDRPTLTMCCVPCSVSAHAHVALPCDAPCSPVRGGRSDFHPWVGVITLWDTPIAPRCPLGPLRGITPKRVIWVAFRPPG